MPSALESIVTPRGTTGMLWESPRVEVAERYVWGKVASIPTVLEFVTNKTFHWFYIEAKSMVERYIMLRFQVLQRL